MNSPVRYNTNPELTAMKEDIAQRNYNIRLKTLAITAGLAVAGAATGGLLLPGLLGGAFMGVVGGGAAGLFAGRAIAEMATLKDREILKIDEENVSSYSGGKNYWGAGYREEVAEYGYAQPQPQNFPGTQPQPNRGSVRN